MQDQAQLQAQTRQVQHTWLVVKSGVVDEFMKT